MPIQVDPSHYDRRYDAKDRWIGYWHQIDLVLRTHPLKVLEIGSGNRTVRTALERQGITVTTADIDPALRPDVVGSVESLPLPDDAADTVLCAEVLEHLPYEKFSAALAELRRVSRQWVVLSLPHWGVTLRINFKLPLFREVDLLWKLPWRRRHVFNGQHFWEIGKTGFPPGKIRADVRAAGFLIVDEFVPPDDPAHHFYRLRKDLGQVPVVADQKRRSVLILFGIAALARLAMFSLFWWRFGTGGEWDWFVLGSDDVQYLTLGKNLWQGVFSMSTSPPFVPDASRTPLLPLFLALQRFLPGWGLILILQGLALAGTLFWYRLAKRLAGARLAWWSTLLFALDPVMLFWTNQFTTEALFSLFWFGFLLVLATLLARPRLPGAVAAGVLLGLAMLTRPIVIFYPVVAVAVLVVRYRRAMLRGLAASAVFVAATALTVSPWVMRNHRVFGVPTVASAGSGIQFGENAPTYLMWKRGWTREQATVWLRAQLPPSANIPGQDDVERNAVVQRLIRQDPFGFAYVMSLSAIPFLFGDGYASLLQTFFPARPLPAVRWDGNVVGYLRSYWHQLARSGPLASVSVFGKLISTMVVAFAVLGALAAWRRPAFAKWILLWLLATTLYFAAASGTIAYSRYRYPVQPILYLFAVSGVAWLRGRRAR